MKEFKFAGVESLDRTVKSHTNTGYLYLPKSWIGKKVCVVLLEDKEVVASACPK